MQTASCYYLEAFSKIIDALTGLPKYASLLNASEKEQIAKFKALSCGAQKLYARLFMRKNAWLSWCKLEEAYGKELQQSISQLIEELLAAGFGSDRPEKEETLFTFLTQSQLKEFYKTHFPGESFPKSPNFMDCLIKRCNQKEKKIQPKISFFGCLQVEKKISIGDRIKELFGAWFKLEYFSEFTKLFNIFLSTCHCSMDSSHGLLSCLILVQIKRLKYPTYKLNDALGAVFENRSQYEEFYEAKMLYEEILENDKEEVLEVLFEKAHLSWDEVSLSLLPKIEPYLFKYHKWHYFCKILACYAEYCEKKKDFCKAAILYGQLLEWDIKSVRHKREVWWERLIIIHQKYFKEPERALMHCQSALKDCEISDHMQLAFSKRMQKMQKTEPFQFSFKNQVTIERGFFSSS